MVVPEIQSRIVLANLIADFTATLLTVLLTLWPVFDAVWAILREVLATVLAVLDSGPIAVSRPLADCWTLGGPCPA
jgi:hypothetical protein